MKKAQYDEQSYPLLDVTERVIGAAYEVHSQLGPGFLEKVYEKALLHELANRGVSAQAQAEIVVKYKGRPVGQYYADFLVDDAVICEIKTVEVLNSVHKAQLLHYLKATGIEVGLLLNFASERLQMKRLVRTK